MSRERESAHVLGRNESHIVQREFGECHSETKSSVFISMKTRLVSRILGTWRHCGVVDNVSYVQGSAQALVIIHRPHISTASQSKGWGV